MLDFLMVADVIWMQLPVTQVITDGHPTPTDTADDQSLQQGRTFPGWALPAIIAMRLSTVKQPFTIVLIFFPGDVTHMEVGNQYQPIVHRQFLDTLFPIWPGARTRPPKGEGASITRIVQNLQGTRQA
jgi:hypothetical protein